MRLALLALLLSLPMLAQTPPTTDESIADHMRGVLTGIQPALGEIEEQTPVPAPPAPAPATSLQVWGAGITLLPQTSPKPTGNAFAATFSTLKGSLIQITEVDFAYIRSSKTIQTSIVANAATPVTILGHVVYAFMGAGGATGASSSAAFAGGGFMPIALKRGWWQVDHIFPGVKVLHTAAGGSQLMVFVDFGKDRGN